MNEVCMREREKDNELRDLMLLKCYLQLSCIAVYVYTVCVCILWLYLDVIRGRKQRRAQLFDFYFHFPHDRRCPGHLVISISRI